MSVAIYLNIKGAEGESQAKDFKDEIDVMSFQWGLSQSGTFHTGSGGGAGRVSMGDLVINKKVDAASPKLMISCANGKHFATAILTVCKAGGDSMVKYCVITLTDVLISRLDVTGGQGDDTVGENVSLNFAKVKFEHKKQGNDGSPQAGADFAWDVQKNSKG